MKSEGEPQQAAAVRRKSEGESQQAAIMPVAVATGVPQQAAVVRRTSEGESEVGRRNLVVETQLDASLRFIQTV